jgi:hypothetical protein
MERFLGRPARKVIRLGSFQSVPQLVADIFSLFGAPNSNPPDINGLPTPHAVLDKINRVWEALLAKWYKPIYGITLEEKILYGIAKRKCFTY